MTARKLLFYLHLTAGSLAGIVIVIMSVTGVLLAYQRQITPWVDRGVRSVPAQAGQAVLPVGDVLAKVCTAEPSTPTGIVLHAQPDKPVEVAFEADRTLYFNSYTGEPIGTASRRTRAFFESVEGVHRWLGVSLTYRPAARMATGIANLCFLALVSSGIFLWWPKSWRWSNLKAAASWKWKHGTSRARDWNWHTVTGFWCTIPLLIIVSCGVVMSFPWATNLLYRATGNAPPVAQPGAGNGPASRDASFSGNSRNRAGSQARVCNGWDFSQINLVWNRAEQQVPGWRTITLRTPGNGKVPEVFMIDAGNGGRPDLKSQLTLDPRTAATIRWEPFSSYNEGRRLRSWVRFSHTGEAAGIFGQTIAALATLGVVILAPTGLAMALRGLFRQRRHPVEKSCAAIAMPKPPRAEERTPLEPSSFR